MLIVAVDFDGTIVDHQFPEIGEEVPGAFKWLRKLKEHGAFLILWTMRSDGQKYGDVLSFAVEFCEEKGVTFDGVNQNPQQASWTQSPKAYAHVYVDDAALGCPLKDNPRMGSRPYVDWEVVGPKLMEMAQADS